MSVLKSGCNTQEKIFKTYRYTLPFKLLNELIILSKFVKNRIGLHYITFLIKCHHKTQGFYAVHISTVNISFKRLKKKLKINKEGKNNECKWKEARMIQA